MANANRTLGGPPGIWCEYNDSMGVRDSGWLQVYVEDNQEALDMIIQSYRIAEDKRVLLPIMPCLDGFVLTHTVEPVEIPEQQDVDSFLPPYEPDVILDPAKTCHDRDVHASRIYNGTAQAECRGCGIRKRSHKEINDDFAKRFGRNYGGLIDTYRMDDAEAALVTIGTVTSTSRQVVDELRQEGKRLDLSNFDSSDLSRQKN